jgi:hypothetical protein
MVLEYEFYVIIVISVLVLNVSNRRGKKSLLLLLNNYGLVPLSYLITSKYTLRPLVM